MATAKERGFSFRDLPTVIDPASTAIEIKLAPYVARGEDLPDEDIRFAQFHKISFPHDALPFVKSLEFANIYGDMPDHTQARVAFAYGTSGILRAVLYRDGLRGGWTVEPMPEEFTGEHVHHPSVRFMFSDHETASRVAGLAARLQLAIQLDQHYEDMQDDAQTLINLIVGQGSEPRFVHVADPPQRREF